MEYQVYKYIQSRYIKFVIHFYYNTMTSNIFILFTELTFIYNYH